MEQKIQELKEIIKGRVITKTDSEYPEYSGTFHKPGSPAVIVLCKTKEDVATAIQFSKDNNLELSVRSGGHGFGGLGTNNGGVVIDLSLFNSVELIDKENSIVKVGGGQRWGEVVKELSKLELALSSGDTNQVGVGGLTLGGGIGWMVRKYGLAIDSLVGAEIITADGSVKKLSNQENSDLFWAIRGGGGNFGVVTSFEFQAKKIPHIVAGTIIYKMTDLKKILTTWSELMETSPEELTSTLMLLPSFGPGVEPQSMLVFCYAEDDEQKANKLIKPMLEVGELVSQEIKKKPYFEMLEDAHPPAGLKVLSENGFIKNMTPEIIDTIVENYGKADSPMIQLRSLGGAFSKVDKNETAFYHRDNNVFIMMATFGPETLGDEDLYNLSLKHWEPISKYTNGAYINFQTDILEASISKAYPKEVYSKLSEIKTKYDPENIFRRNANIKPA